jgi:hypothetical protein
MFDEEKRLIYENRMQFLVDVKSKIAWAEEKGREDMAKAIAPNSISKGIAITTIADATDLAESFIVTFLTNRKGKNAKHFSIEFYPLDWEWLGHAPTQRIAEELKVAEDCYNHIPKDRR